MNSEDLEDVELRLLTQLWSLEEALCQALRQLDRIEERLAGVVNKK